MVRPRGHGWFLPYAAALCSLTFLLSVYLNFDEQRLHALRSGLPRLLQNSAPEDDASKSGEASLFQKPEYGYTAVGKRFNGTWDSRRDRKNLLLTSNECDAAFPGLFDEIQRSVDNRRDDPITLREIEALDIEPHDYVKGYIHDGEIFVVKVKEGYFTRHLAVLESMQRALVSSSEPVPDVEFVLLTDDIIRNSAAWTLCRHRDDHRTWVMPDFGYFSWPEPKVGGYNQVQRLAREIEEGSTDDHIVGDARFPPPYTWQNKIPKLVWRGTAHMGKGFRSNLVELSRGKPWADVVPIDFGNEASKRAHLMSMSDHCKYKYVAHTEGSSYSGRLKYLQNCRSVIVIHELEWVTHPMGLLRSSGPDQNYVQVDRNFTNLEQTMQWLIENDEEAERIADNNARIFRDRYISPAAVVCYWRRLIHGWASVSEKPRIWEEKNGVLKRRGVPLEDYLLLRKVEWDPY